MATHSEPTAREPTEPTLRALDVAPGAAVGAWVGAGGESLAAALAGEHATELERLWGWEIAVLGGDRRAAAGAWAARAGATEAGTLRELARPGIASALVIGREPPSDDDLRALLEGDRQVILALSQPISLAAATRLGDRLGRLVEVPSLRLATMWRAATPLIDELRGDGPLTMMSVRLRCPTGERTVDAMLLDACAACADLLDAPESVVGVGRMPAEAAEARSFCAIVRTALGAIAIMDIADAGGWSRELELLGAGGRLRCSDVAIERWSSAGDLRERQEVRGATNVVSAAADALRGLTAQGLTAQRGVRVDREHALAPFALAEAAKLSARTGNAESPDRMHELALRP
ncbi:MAG: hypothetical protein U0572_09610 [Phycisphaerales bacterium]